MVRTAEDEALARVCKEEAGGVLYVLIAQLRDFDLAEDALADAMTEAVISWRRDGPPRNGAAWLLTVARRRAIDRIRRLSASRKESLQRELVTQLMDRDEEAETDQRSSLTSGCASSLLAAIPPWVLMRKLP